MRVFLTPQAFLLSALLSSALFSVGCGDATDDGSSPDPTTNTSNGDTSNGDTSNGDTTSTGTTNPDTTGEAPNNPCAEPAPADLMVSAPENAAEGAINGVRGGEGAMGSVDVTSLGLRDGIDNALTLRWSGCRVTNGPGADVVVFENPFTISGGDRNFMDLAIVLVSTDGESWVAFPHDYTHDDETRYSNDPDHWVGFAGVNPVLLHAENNPVDPFDFAAAGGDHFDIDDLPDDDEEAARVKAQGFRYLRIITAPSQLNPDTGALYPREPISNGADIDGVYGRHRVADDG